MQLMMTGMIFQLMFVTPATERYISSQICMPVDNTSSPGVMQDRESRRKEKLLKYAEHGSEQIGRADMEYLGLELCCAFQPYHCTKYVLYTC